MFKLTKSETMDLTPKLAKEFYSMEKSPTERMLDEGRVKHLAEKAEHKQLVTFHWSVAVLKGKRLRMNGQHSSTMLTRLNGSFPEGLKVHMDEYSVDTFEDAILLFRQFDDRKSMRSSGDTAWIYQQHVPELKDKNAKNVKLAVEGIRWFRQSILKQGRIKGDDVYMLMLEKDLLPFIIWIADEALGNIKTNYLRSKTVVAAMHGMFIANEEEAQKFWKQVIIGGDQYDDTAPTTALDTWLVENKEKKLGHKEAELYQGCVFAWNAYRAERPVKEVKFDTKKGFYNITE